MKIAVALVALVLAGCAAGGAAAPSASPSPAAPLPAELLPGEDWVLLKSGSDPATPGFDVTLSFEDGKVSGKAPVNRYFGPVQVSTGGVTFGPLASTQMAGPPEAMSAESAYLADLAKVTTWEIADDRLTLSGEDGQVLVFAAPGSTGAFAVTLIGMQRAEAKAAARQHGYEFRVISVDGRSLPSTDDYRGDRIDATVVDGVVTEVTVG